MWVWGASLSGAIRVKGEEWEEETISTNLSTDDLIGFSSNDKLVNDKFGLFSSVVSMSAEVLEDEGLAASGRVI